MIWPIDWPKDVEPEDPKLKQMAEHYAGSTLRMLTLYRVGGPPVTVMPRGTACTAPSASRALLQTPLAVYGRGCWCAEGCGCPEQDYVLLDAPVGRIDEVVVRGERVPATSYRVEDGNRLVRTDGLGWPPCVGSEFTVTYLNAYPVDIIGAHIGGLLAEEFVKALTGAKGCRLPKGVRSVARAGISYEISEDLYEGGRTGITEVDTWVRQWNPSGLRVRPMVYSPDTTGSKARDRQRLRRIF